MGEDRTGWGWALGVGRVEAEDVRRHAATWTTAATAALVGGRCKGDVMVVAVR